MKFLYALAFRLINALVLRTYYAPDEYWQSQEVAHRDVFGYGYLTWEWTRDEPLRSPLYHLLFSACYWVLKALRADDPLIVAYAPRVVQAVLASVFDVYLARLARVCGGADVERWAVRINYLCWFSLFAMPRTIINSAEAVLLTAALYYEFSQRKNVARALVAANFAMRPTSIIPWVLIWPAQLVTLVLQGVTRGDTHAQSSAKRAVFAYFFECVTTVVLMVALSVAVDSAYFGKLTSSALNFVKFNFLTGGADLYGVHARAWYVTQGVPLVLGGWVVFAVCGLIVYGLRRKDAADKTLNHAVVQRLATALVFSVGVLSLSKHKEDRFLLPYLSIMVTFAAFGVQQALRATGECRKTVYRGAIVLAAVSNIALCAFMCFAHNRAALPAMDALRGVLHAEGARQGVVLFTECHQTPYYSFLHVNTPLYFPECTPETRATNSTESQRLFADPNAYVQETLVKLRDSVGLPAYALIYSQLYNFLDADNLLPTMYKLAGEYEKACIWNAYFQETPFGYLSDVHYCLLERVAS